MLLNPTSEGAPSIGPVPFFEVVQLGVRPVVGSPKLKFLVFKLKAI